MINHEKKEEMFVFILNESFYLPEQISTSTLASGLETT